MCTVRLSPTKHSLYMDKPHVKVGSLPEGKAPLEQTETDQGFLYLQLGQKNASNSLNFRHVVL